MHSDAVTVDEYIESFDGDTRELLEDLWAIVREEMPDYTESMQYRMPTYIYDDDYFAFAVQKNYISVYVNKENLIRKHADELGKHSSGKSCIRYTKPDRVNLDGLRNLLVESYAVDT